MLASFVRLPSRFPRRRHLAGEHFVGVQGQYAAVWRLRRGELHRERGAVAGSRAAAATRGAQAHADVAGAGGEEHVRGRKLRRGGGDGVNLGKGVSHAKLSELKLF